MKNFLYVQITSSCVRRVNTIAVYDTIIRVCLMLFSRTRALAHAHVRSHSLIFTRRHTRTHAHAHAHRLNARHYLQVERDRRAENPRVPARPLRLSASLASDLRIRKRSLNTNENERHVHRIMRLMRYKYLRVTRSVINTER